VSAATAVAARAAVRRCGLRVLPAAVIEVLQAMRNPDALHGVK
jgi:hypothetical protein